MIEVSRMNGKNYFLNPDLIRSIESTPDTLIQLTTGEKIMVKEPIPTLVARIINFRKRLVQEPPSAEPKPGEHV